MVVRGVAARDRTRAEEFARAHAIPRVFDSYDELVQSDEIDLVYLPLPNDLHAEWTVRAARAGKHVLVEKPACLNPRQADEIARGARTSGVAVLEAVMTQHHASQLYLRQAVTSGRYGALVRLQTDVSFPMLDAPAECRFDPERGGGVFHEESAYWLQLSQLCFDDPPEALHGSSRFAGPKGTDRTFHARLDYPGNRRSELCCSWERPFLARHRLVFERATLEIPNFLRPSFGCFALPIRIDEPASGRRDKVVLDPACYYTQQLGFMAAVVRGEADNVPWEFSRQRADWLERIYSSARQAARPFREDAQ